MKPPFAYYGGKMGMAERIVALLPHQRLAAALHATPATVILSGYHSPLYDRLYGDWWRQEVPVLVHSSNATTAARAERIEVLWSNRALDTGLFAATGTDCSVPAPVSEPQGSPCGDSEPTANLVPKSFDGTARS